MKNKKIQTENATIMTRGGWIEEGVQYTYKEGSHRHPVILKEILENDEFLRLLLYFPHNDRNIEVSHRNDFQGGYMGMWRLYEYREEDYIEDEDDDWDIPATEISFKAEINRASFISSLTFEQLAGLKNHFLEFGGVEMLGEKEYTLCWLAWLMGEKHLMAGDGMIIISMGTVDVDLTDFTGLDDNAGSGSPDFDLLKRHYLLDELYKSIFSNSPIGEN